MYVPSTPHEPLAFSLILLMLYSQTPNNPRCIQSKEAGRLLPIWKKSYSQSNDYIRFIFSSFFHPTYLSHSLVSCMCIMLKIFLLMSVMNSVSARQNIEENKWKKKGNWEKSQIRREMKEHRSDMRFEKLDQEFLSLQLFRRFLSLSSHPSNYSASSVYTEKKMLRTPTTSSKSFFFRWYGKQIFQLITFLLVTFFFLFPILFISLSLSLSLSFYWFLAS